MVCVLSILGCSLAGLLLPTVPWLAFVEITLAASAVAFAFPRVFYVLARVLANIASAAS
jgi:hypothetical protein